MVREEIFKTLRNNKGDLQRLGVHRIGLFGSHLLGDARPDSDLDFLVGFDPGKKSYDSFIDLCFLLEDLFERRVDLLTIESFSPYLKEQILREARYEIIH